MAEIIIPISIVSGMGLIAGVILSVATIIFHKPVDEKEEALRDVLPGINCGACGFSGCDGYAKAMAEGKAGVTNCTPGGLSTRQVLSEILGVEVGEVQKIAAFVRCNGTCEVTNKKMDYAGTETCYAANQIFGGPQACRFGCMGFGDCKVVCDYDAIDIIDGVAQINPNKCVGCLKCITACPKSLINMLPAEDTSIVACSNQEKGGGVRKICSVGCITCNRCVKACPQEAIQMENNVAVIDPELCTNCGECREVCPQNCILEMPLKETVGS
ncbi:RnfABCDGE type electron transport complex subunit B [Enterococcus sp. AZ072]|uniref:RnfABCDGE type electron transport complex subunit B n=1 Tax=unclassified Enterococcus TaxID=2608891 RepID=UPI003D27AF79